MPLLLSETDLAPLFKDPMAMDGLLGGIEESSAAATHGNVKRSLDQLDDVVRAGIERLKDFQHGDGGWGWWKEDGCPGSGAGNAHQRAVSRREGCLFHPAFR